MLFRKDLQFLTLLALVASLLTSCAPSSSEELRNRSGPTSSLTETMDSSGTSILTTSPGFRQEDYATTHPHHPGRIYAYTDDTGMMPIEEIAKILVNEYLDDMMTKREDKSFEIIEYRNLRIDVMDKETYNNEYLFEDGERQGAGNPIEKDNQWYCYIAYEYHFQGHIGGEGEGSEREDIWLPCAWYLGYTIQRDGNLYRLGNVNNREFAPV